MRVIGIAANGLNSCHTHAHTCHLPPANSFLSLRQQQQSLKITLKCWQADARFIRPTIPCVGPSVRPSFRLCDYLDMLVREWLSSLLSMRAARRRVKVDEIDFVIEVTACLIYVQTHARTHTRAHTRFHSVRCL